MLFPLTLAAATAPSDDPALREGLDPASVTPGTLGFLATLFVVIGVFLLIRDMTKRIRRVRYNSLVVEARSQDTGAADRGDDGAGTKAGDPSSHRIPDAPEDRSQGTPTSSGGPQQDPHAARGGERGPDSR